MNKLSIQRLAVFLACSFSGCSSSTIRVERSFYLMGTSLEVSIDASNREESLIIADEVFETVKADENRLSTWISTSELSKVNKIPVGQRFTLSSALHEDLEKVIAYASSTGFAFNPFIGPLVDLWGLRTGGKIPTAANIEMALKASAPHAFELTPDGIIKHVSGARIEEGGFGKGLALDHAIQKLKNDGIKRAVLNFGGQISAIGSVEIPVEISSPSNRSNTLIRFMMKEGSVTTSSNSEHGLIVREGQRSVKVGHLLNPRTGTPASYDGSITIYASSGIEAEAYSKIFVLGNDAGSIWANEHNAKVLWISPSQKPGEWIVYTSKAWDAPLTLSSNCRRAAREPKDKL